MPRTPEMPAQEALHREIPDVVLNESVTGPATVDTFDLNDVENGGTPGNGTSVIGKWIYIQSDVDYYWRRYNDSAPNSTSMQNGILWPKNTIQEIWVDPNSSKQNIAVEGANAGTIKIEVGTGN